jgi:integrase/recombinase XerC
MTASSPVRRATGSSRAQAALRWLAAPARDRRRSPHTVRAYGATAHRLIGFLAAHLGGPVDDAALAGLEASDLRAFLTSRRAEGSATARRRASSRRCAPSSPSPRRTGRGGEPAPAQGVPSGPRSVPRPVSPDEAVALAEEAGEEDASAEWIAARDSPVLLLLYGSGLRVAEALGLTGAALPLGEAIAVTGKRTRPGSCLCSLRFARSSFICALPLAGPKDEPLFRGARGGPLNGEMVRRAVRKARRPARPLRPDDAACAAPQLRDPFARPRRRPAVAAHDHFGRDRREDGLEEHQEADPEIARLLDQADDPVAHRLSLRFGEARSIASQIRPGVSVPLNLSMATIPVGEVTLISVSQLAADHVDADEQQAAPLELRAERGADLALGVGQLGRFGGAAGGEVGADLALAGRRLIAPATSPSTRTIRLSPSATSGRKAWSTCGSR